MADRRWPSIPRDATYDGDPRPSPVLAVVALDSRLEDSSNTALAIRSVAIPVSAHLHHHPHPRPDRRQRQTYRPAPRVLAAFASRLTQHRSRSTGSLSRLQRSMPYTASVLLTSASGAYPHAEALADVREAHVPESRLDVPSSSRDRIQQFAEHASSCVDAREDVLHPTTIRFSGPSPSSCASGAEQAQRVQGLARSWLARPGTGTWPGRPARQRAQRLGLLLLRPERLDQAEILVPQAYRFADLTLFTWAYATRKGKNRTTRPLPSAAQCASGGGGGAAKNVWPRSRRERQPRPSSRYLLCASWPRALFSPHLPLCPPLSSAALVYLFIHPPLILPFFSSGNPATRHSAVAAHSRIEVHVSFPVSENGRAVCMVHKPAI